MRIRILLCGVLIVAAGALHAQETNTERDTVLKQNWPAIVSYARIAAADAREEMLLKYRMPGRKDSTIRALLLARETKKAALRYLYPRDLWKRAGERHRIDSLYRDSLNEILIPLNRGISGDYITYALKLAHPLTYTALKYTDEQYRTLMDGALEMARRLYSNPRLDTGNDEIELIRKTMTPKQLDMYFAQKNARIATKLTEQAWKRLKESGLAEELDSSRHWMQGYVYYKKRQRILDLYRADKKVMDSHLRDLNNSKPQMIRLLDGLNRKASIRKEEDKKVGKDFVW